MKTNIFDYKLYILDLDGTLYFQKPMRFKMLLFLMFSAIRNPANIKKILVVSSYRKIREHWEHRALPDLEYQQYKAVAENKHCSVEYVQQAVWEFMFNAPLPYLGKYKDEMLAEKIGQLRRQGKRVVVYSDYPTTEKLKALQIEVDNTYCAFDTEIGSLKPRPEGLSYILQKEQVNMRDAIMIGDRYVKDGQAAINCGMDYLILPSNRKRRYALLSKIFCNQK